MAFFSSLPMGTKLSQAPRIKLPWSLLDAFQDHENTKRNTKSNDRFRSKVDEEGGICQKQSVLTLDCRLCSRIPGIVGMKVYSLEPTLLIIRIDIHFRLHGGLTRFPYQDVHVKVRP